MSTTIDRAPELIRRGVPTQSSHETLRRVLLACGIGASLFCVAGLVLGAMRWEGYSSMDQTVSELFAIDAPSRPLVVSLLFVSGVLALAFGRGSCGSETGPENTHAVYGASENGGYLSVTSTNAYATTRAPHRMTPCTKSNMPLGYRPVNKMANQAMITTTIAAIHRKNSTM